MHLIGERRSIDLADEEGTSMVEVMVGLAMGMVVLAGLSMLLIVTMRGSARIGARAEASDNARVTMTRIMEELHSACVTPATAPVQSTSTPTTLIFKRGTYGGAAVANESAITTEIAYAGGKLVEKDTLSSGTSTKRTLLSGVSPIESDGSIFNYENPTVTGGSPFKIPVGGSLSTNATNTILVRVAFQASPKSEPVADAGAATEIRNSATLRLTPPTYRGETARPCE
jgi:Tfp pilus assembly protein PilW